MIGGRDYGQSQLNHALAHRQPGSVFKPFVYAAAFDNAVDGVQPVITPATTVDDEPTTFEFDGKEYTPNNYGEKFMGHVTVADALTNSLNVATVKVAELIGYGRVVQIARQMGLGNNIQATPRGVRWVLNDRGGRGRGLHGVCERRMRAEPQFLHSVVSAEGSVLEKFTPTNTRGARSARGFLVTSLLKDVLNKGTGAGVRAEVLRCPRREKRGRRATGGSRDTPRIC